MKCTYERRIRCFGKERQTVLLMQVEKKQNYWIPGVSHPPLPQTQQSKYQGLDYRDMFPPWQKPWQIWGMADLILNLIHSSHTGVKCPVLNHSLFILVKDESLNHRLWEGYPGLVREKIGNRPEKVCRDYLLLPMWLPVHRLGKHTAASFSILQCSHFHLHRKDGTV